MTAERGFDRVRVEVLLGLLREMTRRHVFDHALAQRADGIVGHGIAPNRRLGLRVLRPTRADALPPGV